MWLPLLSACNLQSLTPLFFCQFFSLDTARYVLGSLTCKNHMHQVRSHFSTSAEQRGVHAIPLDVLNDCGTIFDIYDILSLKLTV